jgi:hypothetical protein
MTAPEHVPFEHSLQMFCKMRRSQDKAKPPRLQSKGLGEAADSDRPLTELSKGRQPNVMDTIINHVVVTLV